MFSKLLVSLIVSMSAGQTQTAAELYVATNGNDQWLGRLAAPNDQKTDCPFSTLQPIRHRPSQRTSRRLW